MPCAQYFVVEQNGRWTVKFQEKLFGPYGSRHEALSYAISAAGTTGKRGRDALVFVDDSEGFATWRFGDNSPYVRT
jgi:hypothetical protein